MEDRDSPAVFAIEVHDELHRARRANWDMQTRHEALAVIWEEFEEFKREVFKKDASKARMHAELIQVAAMCRRAIEDLRLRDED